MKVNHLLWKCVCMNQIQPSSNNAQAIGENDKEISIEQLAKLNISIMHIKTNISCVRQVNVCVMQYFLKLNECYYKLIDNQIVDKYVFDCNLDIRLSSISWASCIMALVVICGNPTQSRKLSTFTKYFFNARYLINI